MIKESNPNYLNFSITVKSNTVLAVGGFAPQVLNQYKYNNKFNEVLQLNL
jgi:hypothetical protein